MTKPARPVLLSPILPADEAAVLSLNNAHAEELSWLEPGDFSHMIGGAFFARRIGEAEAFIIAFDQNADYHSPNFLWFRARHPRFAYVDRICVAPSTRGQGHARRIYEALFEAAKAAGHTLVTCEINAEPPNPGSEAFHAALGFSKVGEAWIHGGKKQVSYYEKRLK